MMKVLGILLMVALVIVSLYEIADYVVQKLIEDEKPKPVIRPWRQFWKPQKKEIPLDGLQQKEAYVRDKINTLKTSKKRESLPDKIWKKAYHIISHKKAQLKSSAQDGGIKRASGFFLKMFMFIGIWLWSILLGLYKALWFLWAPGHYIIRYAPYLVFVNLYDWRFGGEWYIAIFSLISRAIGFGVSHYSIDDDPDYQKKMTKVNIIYLISLFVVFVICVTGRGLFELTGFGLPGWHSEAIQWVSDIGHVIWKSVLEIIFG